MTRIRFLLLPSLVFLFAGTLLAQSKETKIRFSVLDEQNNPVKDLQFSDLHVAINKKPVRINSLKLSGELPLRVMILIDCSMSEQRTIPDEKRFAESFIDKALKKGVDSVGVSKFSSSVDVLYDPGSNFELAKTKLRSIEVEMPSGYIGGGTIITNAPPPIMPAGTAGATTVFDAVSRGISVLANSSSGNKRNVVLLISDGVNTAGDKKLKDAVKEWELSDVTVFAVGIGDSNYNGVDNKTLKKITEPTGGLAVVPRKAIDTDTQLTRLANSMRYYYEATTTDLLAQPNDVKVEFAGDKKLQVNSVIVR